MKKLICMFFAVLLFASSGTINICADATEDQLLADFIEYCEDELGNPHPEDPRLGSAYISEYFEADGVVFFRGSSWFPVANMSLTEKVGDWYYVSPVISSPHGLGLFVQSEGVIYDLKTAWEKGIITDLTPTLEFAESYYPIYPLGDSNGDSTVNVKDATAVQKYIAEIETTLIPKHLQADIMDMNKDTEINIKDATAIQKHLAGLQY